MSPSSAPVRTAATALPSRINTAGEVMVTVTPKNVAENAAAWEFSVVLDTHSVELSEDMVAVALLVDDQDREYRPAAWDGTAPGGHHRSGVLWFRPLAPRPTVLSLKLRSIGGWRSGVLRGRLVRERCRLSTELTSYTPWGYHGKIKSAMQKSKRRSGRVVHRLKIIEGQVRGLQRMVSADAYCVDVIRQSLAIKEALSSLEDFILKNHLATHVVQQMKSGKSAMAVDEILSIYKLSKRK